MNLCIIESPFEGVVWRNELYARLCMRDSLRRSEAPFASHLLYTQVLDDRVHHERVHGMCAGFAWGEFADLRAFYLDLGFSRGMISGLRQAAEFCQPIHLRGLEEWNGPRRRVTIIEVEKWLDANSPPCQVVWETNP